MFWKLFEIHTMHYPFMDVGNSGPGPGCGEARRKEPKALDPIEDPGQLRIKELAAEMERSLIRDDSLIYLSIKESAWVKGPFCI